MTTGTILARWGLRVALAAVIAVVALSQPASAQFDRRGGGGFFESIFGGFPRGRPQPPDRYNDRGPGPTPGAEREQRPVDHARAPAPAKRGDVAPTSTILVLGDSMADWLAYGLEDTLSDQPETAVVRKNRVTSGLLRYEARSDTPDWTQVAREALAAEKPSAVVVMLGLYDRQPIREAAPAAAPGRRGATAPAAAPAPAVTSPTATPPADEGETPSIAAPEPAVRGRPTGAAHEFRSERWSELYGRRIDDMIAVLKSRGVPVFWMGLPSVRGTRSTADMSHLNDLFRARAEKAGIVFVDVWDGFVDEAGRFALQGPDFEGQTRRLRAADGVHFTRSGARKLAHYLDREIKRAAQRGPIAVALPTTEPQTALPGAKPDGGAARPLAGPVMPLTSEVAATDDLLGATNVTPVAAHVTATRVLVKGEALTAPAGRGDDFAWPRRGIASFGSDPVVAMTTLPVPEMRAPPAKTTVAAPATETPAPTAAAQRQRVAARPRPEAQAPQVRQERSYNPFSFLPFFR